ncbi:MAG: DEAD/DEAH box helicase [Archaeoglobaceae archaeon]|nr:DEAD/DEAH box helicase [Archaeoglobaceae archaeon]
MQYITHPLIKEKKIERRSYQISIAATALIKNTLVIIPTGLGKTVIALLVIASRLLNKEGKALVLAPTKPLVEQHANFFRECLKLDPDKIVALSGEVKPEKRVELWENAKLVVSTPQVIENDLIASRISLKDVIHITFDEAHRAVGNYPYVFIAKEYLKQSKDPLILAITASPGSDVERIKEVVENLAIEEIEIRTEHSRDVKPYVHEKEIEWIKVEMPKELEELKEAFEKVLEVRYKKLERMGFSVRNLSKKELLALQETLQVEAVETNQNELFEALSILAEIMKVMHGIELIETQGLDALKQYLKKLIAEGKSRGGSKAAKSLINDPLFKEAVVKAIKCKVEHPKIKKLKEVVVDQLKRNKDSRIIVFTNFRDTADVLARKLNKLIPTSKFVGQASRFDDKGMRQKEQVEVLEKFRKGEIKILVATSVGEEGLDIPSTDLVVFYEAVPSEIRAIQRKGRTGRSREGRIVVLITKGTRDEGYYWASIRKERMMYDKLYELKEKLRSVTKNKTQSSLRSFVEDLKMQKLTIFVDSREAKSGIVKHLYELGVDVKIKNLEVADYVVSDRVAIERKTVEDFVESLISKERLFDQLLRLKNSYQKPLLIIEGESLYKKNVHPNAIRGAIAAIAVDLGIPIIYTPNSKETAEFIVAIAKREQEIKDRQVSLHAGKTKRSLKEQQEYVVSAISDIGPVIAKNLLDKFKTIEKIATASEEELRKTPKVGKKTAEKIRKLMTTPYEEAEFIFE